MIPFMCRTQVYSEDKQFFMLTVKLLPKREERMMEMISDGM